MTFEMNEQVSAEQLSSLRESVGWNRMEKELCEKDNREQRRKKKEERERNSGSQE